MVTAILSAWKLVLSRKFHIPCESGKRQTRPLIRESAPHQQPTNYLTEIKIWSLDPHGCFIPRQTGRLTVGRTVTLTLTLKLTPRVSRVVAGSNTSTVAL
jgi:hypothetical protein